MKKQNAIQRGFTLIELMIVIVILGILMGTILPRLTGAQARARDTSRVADLNNLAQALEVYFNDNGQYPNADDNNCLVPGGATADALGEYLKGGEVIKPASADLTSVGCVGSYFYAPVAKDGVDNAAYVLASDVETYQMANVILNENGDNPPTDAVFQKDGKLEYATISALIGKNDFKAADTNNALRTVYVVIP